MTMLAGVVQQAATSQSGTLPRQESFDRTENGIRQQVDLGTSIVIETGGGRVSADVIMNATDRISNAASGSFIALYTSRSSGHFDVSACPDDEGVAEGTYTFESKHEMSDVSAATASLSGANRAVDAPFRLIDGDDAHLERIEAALDLTADAHGPGTPNGPGPTAPYDWSAAQRVQIGMPVAGSTTATAVRRDTSPGRAASMRAARCSSPGHGPAVHDGSRQGGREILALGRVHRDQVERGIAQGGPRRRGVADDRRGSSI